MSTDARILDAAARILEEVGFRATTTRRIAEEAGVNEVTLFRRFGSKERLLLAALHRQALANPAPPLPAEPVDPEAELRAWCQEHLARLLRVRHVLIASMAERAHYPEACARAGEGPHHIHAELSAWLERLAERGLAAPQSDPRLAAGMLLGALFSAAIAAEASPFDLPPPERQLDAYVSLFLRAIGARPCSST